MYVEKFNKKDKFQFLQTKISVLLGFFHMLRFIEAWSSELTQKPKLKININKGCWLRTIIKNNKESFLDILISNVDLLRKERKKINPLRRNNGVIYKR
jgi:hypothetical protein